MGGFPSRQEWTCSEEILCTTSEFNSDSLHSSLPRMRIRESAASPVVFRTLAHQSVRDRHATHLTSELHCRACYAFLAGVCQQFSLTACIFESETIMTFPPANPQISSGPPTKTLRMKKRNMSRKMAKRHSLRGCRKLF